MLKASPAETNLIQNPGELMRLRWLLLFAMVAELDGRTSIAGPAFTVRDLGPEEATFISNDGQILGDDYQNSLWLWRDGRRVPLNINGYAHAANRKGSLALRFSIVEGIYETVQP